MPDLSDEPTPLVVYDVPGKGPTQLRSAQSVDGAARVLLRTDVRQPPAVTSDECPHRYRRSLYSYPKEPVRCWATDRLLKSFTGGFRPSNRRESSGPVRLSAGR